MYAIIEVGGKQEKVEVGKYYLTEKVNAKNLKDAVLSKFSQTENTVNCIAKQAPQVYETTSKKLAEQKGARLFQEI